MILTEKENKFICSNCGNDYFEIKKISKIFSGKNTTHETLLTLSDTATLIVCSNCKTVIKKFDKYHSLGVTQ